MFDGDHQFIGSRTSSSLSFHFHGNPSFLTFDPYPSSSLHSLSNTKSNEVKPLIISTMDPAWSNDELLALLKLRSSMEICFPDFTWEHLSRKLAELGFKRSGEQCKQKFEEESRHFNTTVTYNKSNYRNNFSELDEFYPNEDIEKQKEDEKVHKNEIPSQEISEEEVVKKQVKKRKKRSSEKFEMFKGFCEGIVKKMISQQEELHKKLIEEIVKRDEEKIARDEAWRNEEIIRVKREFEIREKEQANAGERQATIIEFLKKFTSDDHDDIYTSKPCQHKAQETKSTSIISTHKNPSLIQLTKIPSSPPMSPAGSNMGKRWPRDQVLALINLRCKMNSDDQSVKGPLWERISQGMLELGYNRNAKRCKEKWENINKYFRKTKDSNKKRSVDSRTCPYFHHLSSLYSVPPTNVPQT